MRSIGYTLNIHGMNLVLCNVNGHHSANEVGNLHTSLSFVGCVVNSYHYNL